MSIILSLKKDELPSQKLSKHFQRIFNTKETFIFDVKEPNSNVHLYGEHVKNHLNEKSLNANEDKYNGEKHC